MASKIIKKTLEEANGVPNAEIDFSDKGIVSLEPDMTRIWSMKNVTRLTLSHNKITELPPAVAMMENLEADSEPQQNHGVASSSGHDGKSGDPQPV